jgi:hypothetical protein
MRHVRTGAQRRTPMFSSRLGSEALARSGRLEDAARLLDQALALCRERRERGYETWTLRIFGEIALLREPLNAEHAASAFMEARALAEELKMRPLQAQPVPAHGLSPQGQGQGPLSGPIDDDP